MIIFKIAFFINALLIVILELKIKSILNNHGYKATIFSRRRDFSDYKQLIKKEEDFKKKQYYKRLNIASRIITILAICQLIGLFIYDVFL